MTTDNPILPPANRAGKRVSMALAIAVHLVLAAFLFYGVRWQTKSTDAVEVELVRAVPEPAPAAPVAVPPAPTPAPAPKPVPVPEPKPLPPPPKPDIAIKEKEKPKPPPPKVEPAPPRADPFQEQLKREAEQLNQRKQADTAAQAGLDAALAVGATWLSTNFPAKVEGRSYVATIPGGSPSRCNPVTAPKSCTAKDVEDLGR